MKILVTGFKGFIGRNLTDSLEKNKDLEVLIFGKEISNAGLKELVEQADFICHLAGVNRPPDIAEFDKVNAGLTEELCGLAAGTGRVIPIIFTSSVHTEKDNPYGHSKLAAERTLQHYSEQTGAPVYIFRLPHVIGKWCRPNYNSVVATFCYNIARELPIHIDNPDYELEIVYIDDLVEAFTSIMMGDHAENFFRKVKTSYKITVGALAKQIYAFHESRQSLISENVGTGLIRALYATYISYLPPENFSYKLKQHADQRGSFVEVLKTKEVGQFSFFTAHPGITRGGHYHHTKTEKFIVIKGAANFRFRNIVTNEFYEITTSGESPEIVETVPGWVHDITNIGDTELIVMLWANEIFNPDKPDTFIEPIH